MFLLLINVCHECFSKSKDIDQHNSFSSILEAIDYEGPSPDEIALLRGSRDYCSLLFKGADNKSVILQDKYQKIIQIDKLFVFKFDSNRKMMSVII